MEDDMMGLQYPDDDDDDDDIDAGDSSSAGMHHDAIEIPDSETHTLSTSRRYIQKIRRAQTTASSSNVPRSNRPGRSRSGNRMNSIRVASTPALTEHYTGFLQRLPRHELSYNSVTRAYFGSFEHFSVLDNAISITTSDGTRDSRRRPPERRALSDGRIATYTFTDLDDHSNKHWREYVGQFIAAVLFGKNSRGDERAWVLTKFPQGYGLYRKEILRPHRVENQEVREDLYLYGSPSSTFASPAEYVPHALWLASGAIPGCCFCKYCYRKPDKQPNNQLPITKALEGAISALDNPIQHAH